MLKLVRISSEPHLRVSLEVVVFFLEDGQD